MSKVFIEETTLTAIGDAIREKTGKTELIAPLSMATEISSITTGGGGDIEVEPVVLTGDCQYACSGGLAGNYIKLFGDTVSTNDINRTSYMFRNFPNATIPFEINCISGRDVGSDYMFYMSKIEQLPKINNIRVNALQSMFAYCNNLAYISEDYFDNWNFEALDNQTSTYYGDMSSLFKECVSLRKIPKEILKHGNKYATQSYNMFYNLAYSCASLDELVDVPFIYATVNQKSNLFNDTVRGCSRLKNFTFEMPNGEPIIANMKSQLIDLKESGYCYNGAHVDGIPKSPTNGITRDDFVKDDTTYQALKDTDNWFTAKPEYSRYNRISAVNTINSLPDTSAYLAANGGTNTIKFKGTAGSATDGGAINTMTEEEIAVATAKGWTVSFV